MTRVTIVHDYLTQRGGAERVVLALLAAFPQARLVTSLYWPKGTFPEFGAYPVETLLPRKLPALPRDPRLVFPLLPLAFRRGVRDADVVICSSSGWAHAIATDAPKVVYCHTPPRWLHANDDYLIGRSRAVRTTIRLVCEPLRRWDARAAASATAYVANSTTTAARIRCAYGIEAEVVHPPVTLEVDGAQTPVTGLGEVPFFLTVARKRGYKNTAAAEHAAELAGRSLVVVGSGRPAREGRVHRLGTVDDAELRWLYANCDALVAPAYEDFGLTPIEAMAFGTPVIALRAGGYLDSLVEGTTGRFFARADPPAIADALASFDRGAYDAETIRRHADRFSLEGFVQRIRTAVAAVSGESRPA